MSHLCVRWRSRARAELAAAATERTPSRVAVPDEFFLLGDEVLANIVSRLNSMPFFIFAAKLCPPGVEASMFALFMGLSNFGSAAGEYLGSGLLYLFGGVTKPDFHELAPYVATRSFMRLLPALLVPWLVPAGTPADTAREMGASSAVAAASVGSGASGSDSEDLDVFAEGSSAHASTAVESVQQGLPMLAPRAALAGQPRQRLS